MNRIQTTRAKMSESGLPALFINNIDNVRWISNFTGSHGFVLLKPDSALFVTDSRYTEQAKKECVGFEILQLKTSAPEETTAVLEKAAVSKIGFESAHLSVHLFNTYREKLPPSIELVPTNRLVDDLRLVKDSEEIAAIEAACGIADRTFSHILPFLKPGAIERDVMLEMEWYIRKECRADVAFDTIVASGARSALPHGRASEKAMELGDFVTMDFGARLEGYNSDLTRTVVLGPPMDDQKRLYQTVLEAQLRALDAIKPGVEGKAVDAVAREFIKAAGHEEHFGHGLGHSLGRQVHDGQGFSTRSDITLAPGMVITVEPGIYVPGWGGVRIEDDIVVTDSGCRILTHSTKDLLVL